MYGRNIIMRIGVFADKGMGKWDVQSLEPLSEIANITLFVADNNKHDISNFKLPKYILLHKHETWLSLQKIRCYIQRWFFDNKRLTHLDFYPFSLEEHFSLNEYDIIFNLAAQRSLYTTASLKDKFGYKLIYRYPFTFPFTQIFDERSEFIRDKSFDKIDHFICISYTAKDNLELEGVDPSKIDVVHNSVDLSFFSPGIKNPSLLDKLKISEENKIILFVGKLASWKNPFTILYSLKILKENGLSLKLLLAGQGAQKLYLQKTAKILNIVDDVIFLNFIEYSELNEYYRLADVFVVPSMTTLTWEEQFSFAAIEAMASGLPIVVTSCGGLPEAVGDAGRIYPQGNHKELARHLYEILTDNQVRETMSIQSRRRAEQMFDNKKNSLKMLEVFKKVLAER
jgi:glycosyltransferase involved in cell wall biosynthesis